MEFNLNYWVSEQEKTNDQNYHVGNRYYRAPEVLNEYPLIGFYLITFVAVILIISI